MNPQTRDVTNYSSVFKSAAVRHAFGLVSSTVVFCCFALSTNHSKPVTVPRSTIMIMLIVGLVGELVRHQVSAGYVFRRSCCES